MRTPFGTLLIILGAGLILAGVLANTGLLSWFGRLPGDMRLERGSAGGDSAGTSRVAGLVVAGLILAGVLANTGLLSWFGRLPGDIRIERGSTRVYIPIVSMLLVSIVLSLLLSLVRRIR